MFAAEWGTGQVFLSMVYFFLIFIWIMLLFQVFIDLFSDRETNGFAKFLWVLFVLVLPYLGVFIYLIVRGGGMAERRMAAAQAQQKAMDSYIRETATGGSPAEQLKQLSDLHDAGKLSDEEFASAKAKIVSNA
jgi:hypothetical protein